MQHTVAHEEGWMLLHGRHASLYRSNRALAASSGGQGCEPGERRVHEWARGDAGRPDREEPGHDAAVRRHALERLGERGFGRLEVLLETRRKLGVPERAPRPGSAGAVSVHPGRHVSAMSSWPHYSRPLRHRDRKRAGGGAAVASRSTEQSPKGQADPLALNAGLTRHTVDVVALNRPSHHEERRRDRAPARGARPSCFRRGLTTRRRDVPSDTMATSGSGPSSGSSSA